MKLKKISLVLLTIAIFFITGCGNETEKTTGGVTGSTTIEDTIVGEDFNKNGTGTLKCVTDAVAGDDIEVDISYTVEYKNGNILLLHSVQKIISDNQTSLDTYENAFKNIAKNYDDLKYYDTNIVRDSNTVMYDASINYEKIDTDELLAIEGAEDNIIENGKAKLSLWLDLAEKVGTTCEEA